MKTSLVNAHSTLRVQNNSKKIKSKIDKNLQKLSTGNRVNSAADDAAGLSIASKIRSQVGSSQVALRNANQAFSFVQFAESSLTTVHEILTRLNELAVYNASDTISSDQRAMNNVEFMQLKSEIRRVVQGTKFYERKTLNGSIKDMTIHVGTSSEKSSMIKINTEMFSTTLDALGIYDITADTRQRSLKSLRKFKYAIEEVANARSYYGSIGTVLRAASANLDTSIINNSQAYGRVMDTDTASENSKLVKNKVIQNANTSVQGQANGMSRQVLEILKRS